MQKKVYTLTKLNKCFLRKYLPVFITLGMLFSINISQAQNLYDVDVVITRVEWAGSNWCGDGIGIHVPPFPSVCIDGGNGIEPRYRYRIGSNGEFPEGCAIVNQIEDALYGSHGYKYIGSESSPTHGGPILEDESDTDGANVNSEDHNTTLTAVCGTLTFDLEAWEEDGSFQSIPCPINSNFVYDNNYSILCNQNLDGSDDAHSTSVQNVAINPGTSNISTTFGSYVMRWAVTATPVAAPIVTAGDYSVCPGTTASFVTNPSNISLENREYAWLNSSFQILHIGNEFTTPPINSFPATFYVAQHNNGCLGETTTLTINQSSANCGVCVAPDFLYAYNIDWTSATLGWNAVPHAISYQMEGNPKGLRFLKCVKNTNTNGLQANGLFPFLTYEFRVRTNCPSSGYSPFSAYAEFELNPLTTSTGRLPGNLPNAADLEEVKFDVSGIFVAHRDANARTITVGYFGGEELQAGSIIITDISGRQIYQGAFELVPANVQQIQTGEISDGIYFVSLYKEGILLETEKVLVY